MKIRKNVRLAVFVMASCVLAMPQPSLAADTHDSFTAAMSGSVQWGAIDVALGGGGTLLGQLVDPQGNPIVGTPVQIEQKGVLLASTTTDGEGSFELNGLTGGSYVLASTNCTQVCRAWAPGTAPPGTKQALLLVTGDPLVRGTSGGAVIGLLGNPWVLGGITAAAIAIPLILDHDRAS